MKTYIKQLKDVYGAENRVFVLTVGQQQWVASQ
jgi:hypothetical protein